MQIVIDIPEDLYEGIERRDGALETEYVCDELMKAVDNGTPLPKGHGRLIDADGIKDRLEEEKVKLDSLDIDYGLKRACLGKLIYEVQSSPTIIETEKAHDGGTQHDD